METSSHFPIARPITSGPGHYFFGYYDKSCWDATGRWILGLRAGFMDRPPGPDDRVEVGVIDTEDGNRWTPVTETRAWNWQQGCMLQWVGGTRTIIFNDRRQDQYIARKIDLDTGSETEIDRPIYGVNRTGTHAVSLNFSRLHHQRPGYGYAGVPDRWEQVAEPDDDGIYAIDLTTGETRLILKIAGVAQLARSADFDGKMHRFNHAQFGGDPRRFAFLHRYRAPGDEVGTTRLMTADIDGGNLRCLSDHGMVSHYDWQQGDAILAWAARDGIGQRYFLFDDQESAPEPTIIGGAVLDRDGHCSFSPDGRWVLTDTYPDETDHRTLILLEWVTGRRIDIGRFFAPPVADWQIRCDLHPRWNRDGTRICLDSLHEGPRRMYVLDVSSIVGASTD